MAKVTKISLLLGMHFANQPIYTNNEALNKIPHRKLKRVKALPNNK